MPLPKTIYVYEEPDTDGTTYLCATRTLEECGDGAVAVYEKKDLLAKRTVVEVRRPGTQSWFKPSE